MLGTERLDFFPAEVITEDCVAVLGGTIHISLFGEGRRKSKELEPKEAKLTLSLAFFSEARNMSDPDFKPHVEILGTFKLNEIGQGAEFKVSGEPSYLETDFGYNPQENNNSENEEAGTSENEHSDEQTSVAPAIQKILLSFENDIEDPYQSEDEFDGLHLALPELDPNWLHMEMAAELEVEGTVIAGKDVNGRLDVPLGNLSFIDYTFMEDDEILARQPLGVVLPDDKKIKATTDINGRYVLNPLPKGRVKFILSDYQLKKLDLSDDDELDIDNYTIGESSENSKEADSAVR